MYLIQILFYHILTLATADQECAAIRRSDFLNTRHYMPSRITRIFQRSSYENRFVSLRGSQESLPGSNEMFTEWLINQLHRLVSNRRKVESFRERILCDYLRHGSTIRHDIWIDRHTFNLYHRSNDSFLSIRFYCPWQEVNGNWSSLERK